MRASQARFEGKLRQPSLSIGTDEVGSPQLAIGSQAIPGSSALTPKSTHDRNLVREAKDGLYALPPVENPCH